MERLLMTDTKLSKIEVFNILTRLFAPGHVSGWLSNLPDDYEFSDPEYRKEFIDYINSKADSPALTNTPE